MTMTRGRCRHCGARALIAELQVNLRAPGAVVRCRTCSNVVMVLVEKRGSTEMYNDAFELEPT
jgi:predicted Zn finger-like uncharacterized protein